MAVLNGGLQEVARGGFRLWWWLKLAAHIRRKIQCEVTGPICRRIEGSARASPVDWRVRQATSQTEGQFHRYSTRSVLFQDVSSSARHSLPGG